MVDVSHEDFSLIGANTAIEDRFRHVQLAVRVRPSLPFETEQLPRVIVHVDGKQVVVYHPESEEGLAYDTDFAYWEHATQEQVYEEVCIPCLDAVLNGYNAAVIPYGFAESGKTTTLFGTESTMGMIPRFISDLFQQIESAPPNIRFTVSVSYFEAADDAVIDLLDSESIGGKKRVRVHPKDGFYIENLNKIEVPTKRELEFWVALGNRQRQILAEARGIRYHGFLKIFLVREDLEHPEAILRNSMTFVHLKGSERVGRDGIKGSVFREGVKVNQSITSFNDVLNDLAYAKRLKAAGISYPSAAAATADANSSASASSPNSSLSQINASAVSAAAKSSIPGAGATASAAAAAASSLSGSQLAPFRKSKFTNFVSELIGGNCCTYFVACIAPTALSYFDTMDVLENARVARRIRTIPHVNTDITEYGVAARKLAELKAKLPASRLAEGHPLNELEEQVVKLERECDVLRLGGARDDDSEAERELAAQSTMSIAPLYIPRGPLWRANETMALKHGSRKTVYLPVVGGKSVKYTGQWANNMKTGRGKQVTESMEYDGDWFENKRHGFGTLYRKKAESGKKKRVYVGDWALHKKHGWGVFFYEDGGVYEGEWIGDKRNGMGTMYFPNGDKYYGGWHEDMRSGHGTLYLVNGDRYQGAWSMDKKHGPGMFSFRTKCQIYMGQWHEGTAKCGSLSAEEEYDAEWSHGGEASPRPEKQPASVLPVLSLAQPDEIVRREADRLSALSMQNSAEAALLTPLSPPR